MRFSDFLILKEVQEDIAEINFIDCCFFNEAKKVAPLGTSTIYTDPKTGKTWRHRSRFQQLEQIAKKEEAKGTDRANIWVSFSLIPKLGINPRASDGSTPLGVYAYPIDYVIRKRGIVEYGSDRPYMLVFKIVRNNVLTIKHGEESEIGDIDEIRKIANDTLFSDFLYKKERQAYKIIKKYLEKIEDAHSRTLIERHINEKVDSLFGQVKNAYADAEGNMVQKLESLNLDEILKSFETNIEEEKVDIDENSLKDKLIEIIKSLDWDGEYYPSSERKKYTNVDPETLEAELSPGWRKYWGEHASKHTLPQILNNYAFRHNATFKKFGLAWLHHHSPIGKILSTDKLRKLFVIIKGQIERIIAEYKAKYADFTSAIRFPLDKELKKFAQDNNLDWVKALYATLPHLSGKETTAGSFLYYFTRSLANQMSGKTNRKYYVIWTTLLKTLGLTGVSDEFGTGTIYSSEPTQGVFFDARQAKLINIVMNRSHVDPSGDLSGRPGEDKWSYGSGQHYLTDDPQTQRKGLDVGWSDEDSATVRTFKGLFRKADSVRYNLSQTIGGQRDISKHAAMLSQIVILVKSFLKLEKLLSEEQLQQFKNILDQYSPYLSLAQEKQIYKLMGKKRGDRILPLYEKVRQFLRYHTARLGKEENLPEKINLSPRDFMIAQLSPEEDKEQCSICGIEVPSNSYYEDGKFYCRRHWISSDYGSDFEQAKKNFLEEELKCKICGVKVPEDTPNFIVEDPGVYGQKTFYCPKHWEASKHGTDYWSAVNDYEAEQEKAAAIEAEKQKQATAQIQQTADPAVMKAALKSKIKQIKKKELKAASKAKTQGLKPQPQQQQQQPQQQHYTDPKYDKPFEITPEEQ